MTWSAAQYTKFEDERNRPIHDLLAQIPHGSVARAVDVGCGPGNSTELLLERFPDAAVSGFDSSVDMIAAAKKRLPGVGFDLADVSGWQGQGGPFDVILSNAVLQWVPGHARVLPALIAQLAPSGCLAVQMPDNLDEPAHRLMRATAADGPWAPKLADAANARASRQNAQWYYEVLKATGVAVNIWRTTYFHPLAGGAAAVVEWFKATGLRPFIQPLGEAERQAFLQQYQDAVAEAYPALPDGTVLLPFPRLFFVATRVA